MSTLLFLYKIFNGTQTKTGTTLNIFTIVDIKKKKKQMTSLNIFTVVDF